MLKTDVFERYGAGTMSRRAFYFVLGSILTWGFFATGVVANLTANWQPDIWGLILIAILPFVGIFISHSGNAFLSFVGFNLVVVPFGALLGPALAHAEMGNPGIVWRTALLTGGVSGLMAASGLMFPDFYKRVGGALFVALVCLLIVMIASLFIPALQGLTIIHYLGAGLFALYIGFYMWRASDIEATLDNAVDVAIALYLDILNLFLFLLNILKDD